jgi:hypothetical protein
MWYIAQPADVRENFLKRQDLQVRGILQEMDAKKQGDATIRIRLV